MACPRGAAAPDAFTRTQLFAESAGRCQNPGCNQPLFLRVGRGAIHIAEMAHVFAAGDHGPRANNEMTPEERGSFENLILLCPKCHTIIDKAPNTYTDQVILGWKREHKARLDKLFGAVAYENRAEARAAVEPALAENAVVHREFSPDLEYRENPEAEEASAWRRLMLATILPNNRKMLAVVDANRQLLTDEEKAVVEDFRLHVTDLETKHVEGIANRARRFPPAIARVFIDR